MVWAGALLLASVVPRSTFAQGTTLEATPHAAASAGSTVTVTWSGPNGRGDYITVVRKGSDASTYLDYKSTSDGRAPVNPVSIVLPAEPGAYEIRYVRGDPRAVVATVPYEVTAVTASIEGPVSVTPGSRFEVAWSGPNNGGDWVTIVAADAPPRAYGSYVDARAGRPDDKTARTTATLRAPDQPGRYELRYVQRGTVVIGARAIEVATTQSTGPSSTAQSTATSVASAPGVATSQTLASGATGTLPPAAATEVPSRTSPPAPPAPAITVSPLIVQGVLATTSVGSGTPPSGQPVARSGSAATPAGLSAGVVTAPISGSAAGTGDLTTKTCTTAAAPQFSATPGGVTFTFARPAATTGYRIWRQDLGELTPTPISDPSYTHASALSYINTYQYVINGIQADGGCTTATVSVTPPRPLTPQVTASITEAGGVRLSWGAQADRPTNYLALGAGLPVAGAEVPASTSPAGHSLNIDDPPAGTQSWLVTPLWKTPTGTMSDVSLGGRVSATIATVRPRTIGLAGFTAAGMSIVAAPRTIPLAGFTATGTAPVVPPRTIALGGWTATGSSTAIQGVITP
jgi:hypothetical protein